MASVDGGAAAAIRRKPRLMVVGSANDVAQVAALVATRRDIDGYADHPQREIGILHQWIAARLAEQECRVAPGRFDGAASVESGGCLDTARGQVTGDLAPQPIETVEKRVLATAMEA